eukprot:GILJ01006702.1.p1 GENE.GILJ01006702.1~~GILJ01006702.1.p1  ORF type:complete len:215 (+),score=18.91 GILJ01006702.1:44-688(+)
MLLPVALLVGIVFLLFLPSWPFGYSIRFLTCVISNLFKKRISLAAETSVQYRVWVDDLDFNMHMNNGRYNMYADFGRFAHAIRMGIRGHNLLESISPPPVKGRSIFMVNGGLQFRYKRSLLPFESFVLKTRIHSWDDKWCLFEQRFISGRRVKAAVIVKKAFTERGKIIKPVDAFVGLGYSQQEIEEFSRVRGTSTNDAVSSLQHTESCFGKDE